jgi:hypothetical protein
MLTGCTVTYDATAEDESLYISGSYGWVVHDFEVAYSYDYCQDTTLYLETPYLQRGTKIYIDIYNDYDYAYVEFDSARTYLYDQWFNGAYEAHYTFEADESGYHYFALHDLHPDAVVHVYYQ